MECGATLDQEGRPRGRYVLVMDTEELRLVHRSIEAYHEEHRRKRGLARLLKELEVLNGR